MWGKTNIQGIKDTNLVAGNIKYGVTIAGVTGTFPNDGTATSDKVLNGYTFYVSDATKYTGSYVPPTPLGSIYIASAEFNIDLGATSQGYNSNPLSGLYSVNIGNYIVSLSAFFLGGGEFLSSVFTTNSSSFPTRNAIHYTRPTSGYSITSMYVDSGVIYINDNQPKYHTFNPSTNAFTVNNSGSHTTGTLISSALQLNGLKYEPYGFINGIGSEIYGDIQTKVTKL